MDISTLITLLDQGNLDVGGDTSVGTFQSLIPHVDIGALLQQLFWYTLMIIGIIFVVQLFLRRWKLRYWKINQKITLLERNNHLLEELLQELSTNSTTKTIDTPDHLAS